MTNDSKVGLDPAFTVTRSIPVMAALPDALTDVRNRLEALSAMADVRVEGESLRLRYDASQLGFWEIEDLLDQAGVARPPGLWWRIKAEWFRFTDRNSRDNAHHVAACCSKPPGTPDRDVAE